MKFLSINENGFLIFILFVSGGLFCLVLFIKINNWLRAKRLKKRFSKSRQAEKEAEKILRKNGYTIIDAQKSKPLLMTIGNRIHRYLVRIDYLVRKRGKVFVVEVKSGEKIPYITNRETRRQMLEYYLAYQPCGILLLNMKNKNISEVKFQFESTMRQKVIKLVYFLSGAIFSLVLYYLLQGGWK